MRQDYRRDMGLEVCWMVMIVVLIGQGVYGQAANTWSRKADFGGVTRRAAVGFSIGNIGYIGTGVTGSPNTLTDDFWAYDPTTNTWSQKASFGGGARGHAVGFSIGSMGYIGTGQYAGNSLNDFWAYDPTTNSWNRKADFGGSARGVAVGFSIGNIGYIGTGIDITPTWQNDFWAYDPATDTWSRKADFGGVGRGGAVGFSIGSTGYIGTGVDRFSAPQNDFWAYDPATDTWSRKADFGGGGRFYGVGFSIGSTGFIGTGENNSFVDTSDFWAYDPVTDTWSRKADFGGGIRHWGVGFSIGSTGYLSTGYNATGDIIKQTYNDFWAYSPNAGPMPVSLVYFIGRPIPTGHQLEWQTSQETSNAGFTLLRGNNPSNLEAIATIPSLTPTGTGNGLLNYRYVDTSPPAGLTYYRLRQLDFDGTQHLSALIAIRSENNRPVLFPNPVGVDGLLTLEPAQDCERYDLLDASGRVLQATEQRGPLSQFRLPAGLPKGNYLLRLYTTQPPALLYRISR